MNPRIRILSLPSVNGLPGGQMSGQRSGKLFLKTDEPQVGQRLKLWKVNGNTTILLFSPEGHTILHKERRGEVIIIVMEYFNGIFFQKFGLAHQQHINQSHGKRWLGLFMLIPIGGLNWLHDRSLQRTTGHETSSQSSGSRAATKYQ